MSRPPLTEGVPPSPVGAIAESPADLRPRRTSGRVIPAPTQETDTRAVEGASPYAANGLASLFEGLGCAPVRTLGRREFPC